MQAHAGVVELVNEQVPVPTLQVASLQLGVLQIDDNDAWSVIGVYTHPPDTSGLQESEVQMLVSLQAVVTYEQFPVAGTQLYVVQLSLGGHVTLGV